MAKRTTETATSRRRAARREPSGARRAVRWAVLFISALVVVNTLVGDRGLLATLRAHRRYDRLAADIARERAQNARLRGDARRLRDDPSAIEEMARRELGLIRPGEKVFIIKDVAPGGKR